MRRLFHKMLNEELFTYYFQPIVSATDGSIYAYEALMRGNLPALTRPDQILQLAHEEECLHEIERLTMFLSAKSYATFLSTHQIRGDELLFVNSIASQYMNHDEAVAEAPDAAGTRSLSDGRCGRPPGRRAGCFCSR